MAEIVKELTLEVYSANRIKAIIAKQYDYKSRFLLIRLTDSGEDISVEPSSVVTVNAFRPNGESAAFLGSAESDGRVLVPLSYWMLELEGTVKCDVSIVDTEGRKLSSTNFQIEVERANYSGDDIEPDEHYDLLVELLAEVAQAQEAENARVAAESARVTAENGRVSAETARQTAETARATAETARDTAEGARSSAETARGTAETARASAETTRQSNEASRVSAEASRVAAETAREEAEEEREHALDDYAKKDGYYEGLTAGLSDNLTPYSEDSGTTQTQPFFLEGTATGNGESRVDAKQVPAYAFLQEKRGNMVAVNQLLNSADFPATTTVNGITFTNNGDGTITVNGTATADAYIVVKNSNNAIPAGRSILVRGCPVGGSATTYNMYATTTSGVAISGSKDTGNGVIAVSATRDINGVFIFITNGTTVSNLVFRPKLVDLTQWFNGNIPAYLISHPEAFGRYYKGPLAYEPGRLEPATGRYLTSVGRNIWDEEWEVGGINQYGQLDPYQTNTIRSKNYTSVFNNTAYYFKSPSTLTVCWYDSDKNFIRVNYPNDTNGRIVNSPSNAAYLKIAPYKYGTTYHNDITISLYYSGESGYDKYYPYEVLATIDTGTEQLGFLDYKVPSGLITRATGSVDLGTLNWIYYPNDSCFYVRIVDGKPLDAYGKGKARCAKYPNNTSTTFSGMPDKTIDVGNRFGASNICSCVVKDSVYTDVASFKAAMSGVILYYELAEPTTEQGTPFQENVPIDDFGQLSWSNTDVPQGNQIFYPVDYKAYEDTLIKYTDGDATSIALKGAITDAAFNARGYYKMQDLSNGITDVAGLTYETKKLYKCGNILTLFVKAINKTGSDIANGSVLFTLPSGTYMSFQYSIPYLQEYTSKCAIMSSNRILNIDGAIPNGKPIFIAFTYAVA